MEGSIKRNKRDRKLLHKLVVCSIKAPAGLEIGGE
jgi:hypothetical protein